MSSQEAKEQGNRLYKEGRYAAAVDAYTAAIEMGSGNEPDLHITYSNRCACNMKLDKFGSALDDAQACVRLKPTWAKGHSRLGSCLVKLGRAAEAIPHLECALDLDPDNVDIQQNLAVAKTLAASGSSRSSTAPSYTPSSTKSASSTSSGAYGNGSRPAGGASSSSSHTGSSTSSAANQARGANTETPYTSSNYTNDRRHDDHARDYGNDVGGEDIFGKIKAAASQAFATVAFWWNSLEQGTRKMIIIAGTLYILYWMFLSGPSRPSYRSSYGHYSSGYSYVGGMTWTMWGAIMLGAWMIPPRFPHIFGDYAKPFFGMSLMTFMWLLNMFGGRGGGMYVGGRGGGGLFGRRRY
jgi:hypothetical protein